MHICRKENCKYLLESILFVMSAKTQTMISLKNKHGVSLYHPVAFSPPFKTMH